MSNRLSVFLFILGILFVLGVAYVGFAQKKAIQTPSVKIDKTQKDATLLTTVAENLEIAWALVFLPDGRILFAERPGRVRIIDAKRILSSNPAAVINDVKHAGEGGLLGITIHPDFSANRFVYLYYTYSNINGNALNRVARFEFRSEKLQNQKIIVDNIPGASNHNGGRIKFGPDGFLYIATGDVQNPSLAQNTNSLAGKILRVTDDGKPAPGNPFNNTIYSYGHRNPQGLSWDENGNLWETEHGPITLDELNIIEEGKNYGWPVITGDQKQNGMETPILNSGLDTWAPSGTAFLNGSIFFAGLRGQALFEYDIKNKKLTAHLKNKLGRIREVVVGPDNSLYITTNNRDGRGIPNSTDDKILRINPAKL